MKRSIKNFKKIFSKAREIFDRYASRTLALFCAASFATCAYLLFRTPTSVDELFPNRTTCGNTKALTGGPARFDRDVLSLEVRDEGFRKFVISGALEVSRQSYLKHFKNAKDVLVRLDPEPSRSKILVSFPPTFVRVKSLENREIDDRRWVTIDLKDQGLIVDASTSQWFPFEDYRVGFSASVLTLQPSATTYRTQAMDATIVNATFSNAFIVHQAKTMREFIREPDEAADLVNVDKEYPIGACVLIVSRPHWYRAMVLFLLSLLFAPVAYIYYRRNADPGVELIAAILGIAAIRYYLLGDLNNWNFYYIDAAFGFTILLTAFIPLWRLRKRSSLS